MPYKNKEDQAVYQKKYREANRAKVNSYGQYGIAARRERNSNFLKKAKNKPCMDCGIVYPSYVMDFDHVEGNKSDCISKLVNSASSLETIQTEINKCELVCANCHRERTHQRKHQ